MPIRFKYKIKYTYYPHSERATRKSYALGCLTAWPACLVYGFFWMAIFAGIFEPILGSYNHAMWCAVISLVGLYFLIKRIKESVSEKIEAIAAEDYRRKFPENIEEQPEKVNRPVNQYTIG